MRNPRPPPGAHPGAPTGPPVVRELVEPERLYSRCEVLALPCPVAKVSGIYAWYFREIPPGIDAARCVEFCGLRLLYTGVAPGRPPKADASHPRTLRDRVPEHYDGTAYGSTLRRSLGVLCGIPLRRVGNGKRTTFHSGECDLDEWMAENAFVIWTPHPKPLEAEAGMVAAYDLPLNLVGNEAHPFFPTLRFARKNALAAAKEGFVFPSVPRNRRPELGLPFAEAVGE
jgi:hypothetical protein